VFGSEKPCLLRVFERNERLCDIEFRCDEGEYDFRQRGKSRGLQGLSRPLSSTIDKPVLRETMIEEIGEGTSLDSACSNNDLLIVYIYGNSSSIYLEIGCKMLIVVLLSR
jgi:hypothetical protein